MTICFVNPADMLRNSFFFRDKLNVTPSMSMQIAIGNNQPGLVLA